MFLAHLTVLKILENTQAKNDKLNFNFINLAEVTLDRDYLTREPHFFEKAAAGEILEAKTMRKNLRSFGHSVIRAFVSI